MHGSKYPLYAAASLLLMMTLGTGAADAQTAGTVASGPKGAPSKTLPASVATRMPLTSEKVVPVGGFGGAEPRPDGKPGNSVSAVEKKAFGSAAEKWPYS